MSDLLRDIRHASRGLLKSPSFSAVTLLTLAIAIGANTAIFSVVDGVLLRPLPYPDADHIVTVSLDATAGGVAEIPFSDRGYWHFAEKNRSVEAFGGYSVTNLPLVGEGEPVQVQVAPMTRSAFDVLGVAPMRGRLPLAEEDAPGAPVVVLISHAMWQNRFGGREDIIGSTVNLSGAEREVIGVMPPGFDFPSPDVDFWVPYRLDPASQNFGGHHISGIARLRPGTSIETGTADVEHLVTRLGEAGYGPQWFTNVFTGRAHVRSWKEQLVGDARKPLLILLGTVGFVLLIACSNIANLFLLRAEGRTRDTAVRIALGAGRGSVIRYVVVESMLLAFAGGVAGILVAALGTRLLVRLAPVSIPRLHEIGITMNVLLFTLGVTIFAGLLFGVLPALRSFSYRMVTALRDGGRGATVGRERHRARNVLVVLQVAMALLLLVGAGLMVRSYRELRAVDPGFRTSRLVTFQLSLPPARYQTPEATARFYDDLLARVRTLPGVEAAGAVTELPLNGAGSTILATQVEELPTAPDEFPPTFHVRRVTPGYFEALGIPVVEGRTFEDRDHQRRLGTAVISEGVKERFWKDTSPLGKRVAPSSAWANIIGVVGDVHQSGLAVAPEPTIYMPMLDSVGGGVRTMSVVVRSTIEPTAIVPALRGLLQQLDPALPITDLRTVESLVGDSMSRTTFTAFLLVLAALVGLFLGAIGIYGVISYGVAHRTVELGIRQALGATASRLRGMIVRRGVGLTAVGVMIGLAAAAALGRVMTSLLYGVQAFDAVTFTIGAVVFLLVAVLASLVPAHRVSRIAPSEALRAE